MNIPVKVIDERHKLFNHEGVLIDVEQINAGKVWKVRMKEGYIQFFFKKEQLKRI